MPEQFSFGEALEFLKEGKRVLRIGWNGKGMWLLKIHADDYVVLHTLVIDMEEIAWIGMKTADNKFVPWLASQTDIQAEDWIVYYE